MILPKVVIFDMDGVITDSGSVVWDWYKSMNGKFQVKKYDTKDELLSNVKRTVLGTLFHLGVPVWQMPKALKMLKAFLGSSFEPKIFPGIKEALSVLSKHYTLAVVSSNKNDTVKQILNKNKIDKHFQYIFGTGFAFSKTRRLKCVLRDLGVSRYDAVFVTDTVNDVVDGKKAGLPVVGVAWGFHTQKMLLDAGALRIAISPKDLEVTMYG